MKVRGKGYPNTPTRTVMDMMQNKGSLSSPVPTRRARVPAAGRARKDRTRDFTSADKKQNIYCERWTEYCM